MADEAKALGNAAFSAGKFQEAIDHFTAAIALAPSNHVLYSNRSACFASLNKYSEALADAQKTADLKPDWPKAYSRLGAAYIGLNRFESAVESYKKGLEIEPSNEALKSGLADANACMARKTSTSSSPLMNLFQGPEVWVKLQNDPKTRELLKQPDFVRMVQELQRNPNATNMYGSDPRMMQVLRVLLQMPDDMRGFDEEEESPPRSRKPEMKKEVPAPAAAAPEPEPEPEPMEVTDEEKEKKSRKVAAGKEKEAGNEAYKKKRFEAALEHYSKAMELDDEDISYLTNRAAVYFEMGKYEECITDCDKAVERGRELHSDFKMIARALTRKGTAYVKLAKSSKDYEPAIEAFHKALTEHRNPDTLKRLNEAEKAKKELEQHEYFDPKLADEEREKGNELFKEQKYPEAMVHYNEALKRNPNDVKAYSNRAASYTKLGAFPEGLKDATKCLELDPSFIKGYSRKGAIQFFMKDYDKALETYQTGLKYDEHNQEMLDGIQRCVEQINKTNRGDISPEELKERQAKSLQDPEIQAILSDPVMRQVLTDFQESPKAAQEHMKNPMIMTKIQKLVSAGIVQVR